MNEYYRKRKAKTRRNKKRKNNERYTFGDFIFDVLFWIPEILIFPFRFMLFLFRSLGKLLKEIFDFI